MLLEASWNVMAHSDVWEGKWRGNWQMEWVASTLHNTSEHGASSITTADAHTSAASSPLNWRPRWFKWNHPFRWKVKCGFCAYAITFQVNYHHLISTLALSVPKYHTPMLEFNTLPPDGMWRTSPAWTPESTNAQKIYIGHNQSRFHS
jgi:hypothetical protein